MSGAAAPLSPAQAAERIASGGVQVLDVRTAAERVEDGFIAGDTHIELVELSERAGELDPDAPVLVYCAGGTRSAMAAEALRAAGFEVDDLGGGLRAWTDAGQPVAR